jgi:hypothetical protein
LKIAGHRSAYVYRSAVSQKVLMGMHSLRTASALSEFRIGTCKADLVIVNGTGTVYEIKSERDSLVRLNNQTDTYKRVFAKVNVIASEEHIEAVINTVADDIGILCLSKRYQISMVREAADCPARICPLTVFDSLRMAERIAILQAMGIDVPEVPNTEKHTAMRKLFSRLEPTALHAEMVRTIKQTRSLAPLIGFVDCLPQSLQAAALSISVRRSDQTRLLDAIKTPLRVAMTWR